MGGDEPTLTLATSDVHWRTFGDQVVLLDLRSSKYLSTNRTATVLWRLLEQGTTRRALVSALMAEYGIEEDVAVRDVDAFVDECRKRDLVREA